ncbi:MAG: hemerythrin [Bacteroidetes bacterium]|nr:hemerythrin family protein [Bacteroidales bacterium]RLD50109.1 MAG: hemerythrin [Bacteroidota bacterium]
MSKKLVTWSEIYSVGIKIIDEQHERLIDLINILFNSFSEGNAENIIPEIIKELKEYTEYHFKTEENLFEKYNYPDKENHIQKHKDFIQQVDNWKDKMLHNDENLHYELMNYLKKWLTEHITGDDFKYKLFFKENNIKI